MGNQLVLLLNQIFLFQIQVRMTLETERKIFKDWILPLQYVLKNFVEKFL